VQNISQKSGTSARDFCFPYPIEKTWVKFVRIWRANVPTFARTACVSTPYDSDVRSNLAQAGATTPEMIEPLAKRINDMGWHIQINAEPKTIQAIMPILQNVPTPIVFDHLAHIPQPDGVNHPLFGQVLALIDKGKTWVKLSGAPTRKSAKSMPVSLPLNPYWPFSPARFRSLIWS